MIIPTVGNRTRIFISVLFVILFIQTSIASAQEEQAIGIIKTIKDEAFIIRGDERVRCQTGDSVFSQDALETDESGSLGITLKDNTRLSLGPNSYLTLNEFTFNPKQEEYSFITKLIRGTLVYLSGIIAKLSPESVSIETPTATVGIRGTRLVIRVEDEENSANQEGQRG